MASGRRLRDPLHAVPVKYKLTLGFAGVGLLAFGVGGFLASHTAERALERAVRERLAIQVRSFAAALGGQLDTLTRRAEDFASDGYIRTHVEALQEDPTPGQAERLAADLREHLVRNKLSIESAFLDLTLTDPEGRVLLGVHHDPPPQICTAAATAPAPWYSPWVAGGPGEPPRLAVATALTDITAGRPIGHLLAWVNPGVVVLRGLGGELAHATGGVDLRLLDRRGQVLCVPRSWLGDDPPAPDSEVVASGLGLALQAAHDAPPPGVAGLVLTQVFPVADSRLSVEVLLDASEELAVVSGLRSRFLAVGALLALAASAFLYFPVRFLARPLEVLTLAARRMRAGDLGVRVPVESEDEIGALGDAFNRMAESIEERTGRLEESAADLRRQRRAAAEERDRLEAVISSMRDGLVVLDGQGRPVVANSAARALLRLLEREGEGALISRHGCHAREEGRDCERCLFSPREGPTSCVLEFEGGIWEVQATPLAPDAHGHTGRVLVSRDVTGRVAQDERQIHQERLAVLGEVAAVVAHELNNPLAAIRMYNQLMQAALPANSELREHVEVIGRNTETCSRTIRELLDYATDSSPEIGPMDVHAILEDVATFLRPLRERAGIELELALEASEDATQVVGDEIQLRQVFVNLLMNAIQAQDGRRGRIAVRTGLEENHLFVEVEDGGPGIPDAWREQVFRPFFTTKSRGEGTGLGLSTSRRIAELHGGSLELVESRPGRTVFRVRLLRRSEVTA